MLCLKPRWHGVQSALLFAAIVAISLSGKAVRAQPNQGDTQVGPGGLAAEAAAESDVPNPAAQWLRERFPDSMQQTSFLLADYQWVCLVALIFLGFLADMLSRFALGRLAVAAAKYLQVDEVPLAATRLWRPVGLLANAITWYFGTEAIGLPTAVSNFLLVCLKLFSVVATVWTAFLLIDLLTGFLLKKATGTKTRFDDLLIPLVSKSLKALAICVGLLTGADALNLPIAGLIGGLGIGGLALAMASKDAVSNLFGSFTVLVDRPFEVGDWIVLPGAEGTVEDVGFRSTRVRTFYNSMVTVPNCLLTTAVVDNMGRRRYRRIKTTLGVQYDTTPEQLDAFCEGIRELIRRHPYTRKDYYHVYFHEFGASSLDILMYCFLECPDWAIELREKHRLLSDILRLAGRLDVTFAFPTRTLHLFQEERSETTIKLGDPLPTGRQLGAELAGAPPGPEGRPGAVEF